MGAEHKTKFRDALTKQFGEPVPACHNDVRDIWKVSDKAIAALTGMGDQIAVLVIAMPLENHECGKP